MRIAVAGKGGAGKTTISATLARTLARSGKQVLAIDGDPNPNLGMALGVDPELLRDPPRVPRNAADEITDDEGRKQRVLQPEFKDFREQWAVRAPDGVMLVHLCAFVSTWYAALDVAVSAFLALPRIARSVRVRAAAGT